MKRTKFIAGALVLSMGLLGTGYAYWTDAISATATVNTGNLDVAFKEGELISFGTAEHIEGGTNAPSNKLTTTTVTGVAQENTATITINDLCPGYTGGVGMEIVNAGTMATRLEGIKFVAGGISDPLKDEIGVRVEIEKNGKFMPLWDDLKIIGGFEIADTKYIPLKDAEQEINSFISKLDSTDTLFVNTKENAKVKVTIGMKTDAASTTEELSGAFDVVFNWTQYNNPVK